MSVLVRDNVTRTLFTMAFPMLAGTFAMNAYSLTDTWFVSLLGTESLAAMGFTFPVVMILNFIAGGVSSGVTTLASHALGRRDQADAARLLTHGGVLVVGVTIIVCIVAYLCMTDIFTLLGADERTMPLIRQYMGVWYFGSPIMALPMLGNGVLISLGDSKSASRFILLGAFLNVILDPILIFGYLGCPAMGITGAALATVLAHVIAISWMIWLLRCKHKLLSFDAMGFGAILRSTRRIVVFAVPNMFSMLLMPISATVITKILSEFGNEAVAAAGAAGRIEMFAFVIPMALGMSLTPFVSQNYGAGRIDRVREAQKKATIFALGYGGFIAVTFFLLAPQLAGIFSDDPNVLDVIVQYVRIISFGYGMMEVHRYCGFFLTGLHKPYATTILNAVRVFVFLIPLAYLGAYWGGLRGVFFGRLATDIAVGGIGLLWAFRATRIAAAEVQLHPPKPESEQDVLTDEAGAAIQIYERDI